MAQNIWQLREQRGMSTKQLAAKAGIPLATLEQYESGQPLRSADIGKLAKALFVGEFDIKIKSDPKPVPKKPSPPKAQVKREQKSADVEKPQQKMAQPGHLNHMHRLCAGLGMTEEELLTEIGKPLDSLTLVEAKKWLKDLSQRLEALKDARRQAHIESARPPGTRRKRAQLPEGIDEFELTYLAERQEKGDILHFVLLNGEKAQGKVIGFSPYNICIQTEDGREIILEKLALAYYYREMP